MLPLIALFGRLENSSRKKDKGAVGSAQATLAAVITCAGLTVLALTGIGSASLPGFNWIAVALVLVGVGLGTYRLGDAPEG